MTEEEKIKEALKEGINLLTGYYDGCPVYEYMTPEEVKELLEMGASYNEILELMRVDSSPGSWQSDC